MRYLTLAPIAVAVWIGGCGGGASSGNSPAQFATKAGRECRSVAPGLKQTSTAITALDQSPGNPLDKLPKLATLLGQLDMEFADLHRRLGAVSAPSAQRAAYARFLSELNRLEQLTGRGTAFLRPGTIGGLRQFKALGVQLNASTSALAADAAKVPGLAACNNLS